MPRGIKPDPPHALSDLVGAVLIVLLLRNDEFREFGFDRQDGVCVYTWYTHSTVGFFVFFVDDEYALAGADFPVKVS